MTLRCIMARRLAAQLCLLIALGGMDAGTPSTPDYERLLFPDGIPERDDYYGGGRAVPEFDVIAEAESERTAQHAVLYALKMKMDTESGDPEHLLFLAIFSEVSEPPTIQSQLEVTELSPMSLEIPGTFQQVAATLNWIDLPSHDCSIVHLNLWSRISGTGGFSSGSDLLFAARQDGALDLLAELPETSSHASYFVEPPSAYRGHRLTTSRAALEQNALGGVRLVFDTFDLDFIGNDPSLGKGELESRSCKRTYVQLSCDAAVIHSSGPCLGEMPEERRDLKLVWDDTEILALPVRQ